MVLAKMLADSQIKWLGIPMFLHPGYNRPIHVLDVVPERKIGVKGVQEIWLRRDLSSPPQIVSRYLVVQENPAGTNRYIVYTSTSSDFLGEVWEDCVDGEAALHRYFAGAFPKSFRWLDEPLAIDPDTKKPISRER